MSFDPGGGGIANARDVALNNPANNQNLTYNGAIGKWTNQYGPLTSVKDFGAVGDGATDDAAAIQTAIDAMLPGGSLFFPEGVYVVGSTIQLPIVDGASLIAPIASQVRNPAAVLRAKNGANLKAIAATQEWLTNGARGSGAIGGKDAQGITIQGLGFDGGGFSAGSVHNTQIETTANTKYGLVIHGTGFCLNNIFVVSANSHGIYIPGVGKDESTPISESHEGSVFGCGVRYTGGDGFHAGPGAQDSWVEFCKIQYAGGHCVFIDDNCAGWSFIHNHPSWGAKDIFHLQSGWQVRVADNYIGSVGEYMDGSGNTRYAIYVENGPFNIHNNSINTNTSGGQQDQVIGIYLKNGWGNCVYNTLIYQLNDNFGGMVATTGLDPISNVVGNIAKTP